MVYNLITSYFALLKRLLRAEFRLSSDVGIPLVSSQQEYSRCEPQTKPLNGGEESHLTLHCRFKLL